MKKFDCGKREDGSWKENGDILDYAMIIDGQRGRKLWILEGGKKNHGRRRWRLNKYRRSLPLEMRVGLTNEQSGEPFTRDQRAQTDQYTHNNSRDGSNK